MLRTVADDWGASSAQTPLTAARSSRAFSALGELLWDYLLVRPHGCGQLSLQTEAFLSPPVVVLGWIGEYSFFF